MLTWYVICYVISPCFGNDVVFHFLFVLQCWCGSHRDFHHHRQCPGTGSQGGHGGHLWDDHQDTTAEDEDGSDCGTYVNSARLFILVQGLCGCDICEPLVRPVIEYRPMGIWAVNCYITIRLGSDSLSY